MIKRISMSYLQIVRCFALTLLLTHGHSVVGDEEVTGEKERPELLGRWRLWEGEFPEGWWGYRGLLNALTAKDQLDLFFEEGEAKQFRTSLKYSVQGDLHIMFGESEKSCQIVTYQLDGDRLYLRMHAAYPQLLALSDDSSEIDTIELRRVVELKHPDPAPDGFIDFDFPNSLAADHDELHHFQPGKRVDVLTGADIGEDISCYGRLLSDVELSRVAGPSVMSPRFFDVSVRIPKEVADELKASRIPQIAPRTDWFGITSAGLYEFRKVTPEEVNGLYETIDLLDAAQASDDLAAKQSLLRKAVKNAPEWSHDSIVSARWKDLQCVFVSQESVFPQHGANAPDAHAANAAVGDDFPPGEHPFDGHWKLKSATTPTGKDYFADLVEDGVSMVLQQVFIKDRKLQFFEGEREEYPVKKDGSRFRVLKSQSGGDFAFVDRFENVLFMQYVEDVEQPVVFEFWRVDPERDKLLEALKERHAEVSQLRKEGRAEEIAAVAEQINELNGSLERLDHIPAIESQTLKALKARRQGDHAAARAFEQEARLLSQSGDVNHTTWALGSYAADAEPPSGVVDVEIDATLSMTETALKNRLPQLEDQSRSIAQRLRSVDTVLPLSERQTVEKQLATSVREAFDTRWKLQELKLEQAEFELLELRRKHQRRKDLADEIIGRRIKALLEGDETEWLQTNAEKGKGRAEQSEPRQPQTLTDAGARHSLQDITFDAEIDPRLRGRWKLKSVTGAGIISHEQNVEVEISTFKYTLIRRYLDGKRQEMWARTDTTTSPSRILFSFDAGNTVRQRSIYRLAGNTLSIASEGLDADFPTDFDPKNCRITTLERVVSLPDFETPQELIDFMIKVGGTGGSQAEFDQYVQLLTEDEQKRFAGVMLTTVSMMEGMGGMSMFAAQLGAEFDSEDAVGLAKMSQLGQLIPKHMLTNPPADAKAMYDILRSRFNPVAMMAGLGGLTQPTPANDFSRQLRLAAGVFKDPVAFCKDAMNVMHAMDPKNTSTWAGLTSKDWDVVITGETATARKKPGPNDDKNGQAEVIELARIGNTWKITSIISDEMIASLAQGPTISDSSDNDD